MEEDLGIFKDVDMTNLPRLRNSLRNKSCGPLKLPTRNEIENDFEYGGWIDSEVLLEYCKEEK
jgi:hypothetical protein